MEFSHRHTIVLIRRRRRATGGIGQTNGALRILASDISVFASFAGRTTNPLITLCSDKRRRNREKLQSYQLSI